jgi:hypothetical protein
LQFYGSKKKKSTRLDAKQEKKMWKLFIFIIAAFVALHFLDESNKESFDGQIVSAGLSSGFLQEVGSGATSSPVTLPSGSREKYLEDMVKYLLIVVNMTNARQEKYKLENGYAQTFSSPRLDALERQRQFFIEKVKKDPAEIAFFRENLVVMV